MKNDKKSYNKHNTYNRYNRYNIDNNPSKDAFVVDHCSCCNCCKRCITSATLGNATPSHIQPLNTGNTTTYRILSPLALIADIYHLVGLFREGFLKNPLANLQGGFNG